jgi:poly(3-hydroxybutyrate) depolymerase
MRKQRALSRVLAKPHRLAAALAGLVLTASAAVVVALPASPAMAADPPPSSLVQVSSFGSNPGALSMYTYTPAGLATGRPVVVALHGCTQTASDYYTHSGWPALADRWQFEVVFPQQSSANNSSQCFNWFSTADDTRGNGEAASIKSMVDKAVADHGSDTSRVFVTGLSAGGGMTADLLAAYPDVFAAVVSILEYPRSARRRRHKPQTASTRT